MVVASVSETCAFTVTQKILHSRESSDESKDAMQKWQVVGIFQSSGTLPILSCRGE